MNMKRLGMHQLVQWRSSSYSFVPTTNNEMGGNEKRHVSLIQKIDRDPVAEAALAEEPESDCRPLSAASAGSCHGDEKQTATSTTTPDGTSLNNARKHQPSQNVLAITRLSTQSSNFLTIKTVSTCAHIHFSGRLSLI